MAEFKIGLGLEIVSEDKVAVQKIIDDIRAEKPAIKVNVDTSDAVNKIKQLKKELNTLKNVTISIKGNNSSSGYSNIKSGISDLEKLEKLAKSMQKNKFDIAKLTGNGRGLKEHKKEISAIQQEYDEARESYEKLRNELQKEVNRQSNLLDSIDDMELYIKKVEEIVELEARLGSIDKTAYGSNKNINRLSARNFDIRDNKQAFEQLKQFQDRIEKLQLAKIKLNVEDNSSELQWVENKLKNITEEYNQLYSVCSKDLSTEQIAELDKRTDKASDSVEQMARKIDDLNKKAQKQNHLKEISGVFKDLMSVSNQIGKLEFDIAKLDTGDNKNEIDVLTVKLNELRQTYTHLYTLVQGDLSDKQLAELGEEAYKTADKIEQLNAKVKDTQNNLANKIGGKLDSGDFSAQISNITTNMNKLSTVSDELQLDVAQLDTLLDNMIDANNVNDVERLINNYNEFNDVVKKVKNSLTEAQNAQKNSVDASKLIDKQQKLYNRIDIWLKENSAGVKEFGAELKKIQSQIASADNIKLDGLSRQVDLITQKAKLAGKTGLTFGDTIKKQWEQMRGYFTLYDVYSYAKQGITSMFQEVNKVDMAMSGLYRVTDLTTTQYQEMYNGMTESAKRYGLVLSELIDGATTWAKLGFSGTQASELGEISGRYQVVADTDAETAVTNLVTAYNGFKDELLNLYDGDDIKAVEYVSDIFNKLGNEYAIDAESIGVALTKSASALSVAGNDIQQASGMITGIAEKTGNAERGSNALKILSLRLRGKHIFGYNPNDLCLHTRKVRMLYCI